ncbi:hypothetical protein ACFPFV_07440 [Salinicoccus siamensis]|uniref:Uncharacterized protein n=1 Tax=Salinicoccus siamensis TaxID=381830 RepID=A0ABV5Z3W1_9STAP
MSALLQVHKERVGNFISIENFLNSSELKIPNVFVGQAEAVSHAFRVPKQSMLRLYEDLGTDLKCLNKSGEFNQVIVSVIKSGVSEYHNVNYAFQESLQEALTVTTNSENHPQVDEDFQYGVKALEFADKDDIYASTNVGSIRISKLNKKENVLIEPDKEDFEFLSDLDEL